MIGPLFMEWQNMESALGFLQDGSGGDEAG